MDRYWFRVSIKANIHSLHVSHVLVGTHCDTVIKPITASANAAETELRLNAAPPFKSPSSPSVPTSSQVSLLLPSFASANTNWSVTQLQLSIPVTNSRQNFYVYAIHVSQRNATVECHFKIWAGRRHAPSSRHDSQKKEKESDCECHV